MQLPKGFQESLTELVMVSLYNYHYAKTNEENLIIDSEKLKQEAIDEYSGKFNFNSTAIRYPFLRSFTRIIVDNVVKEIENLPSGETSNDRALMLINELLETDQETITKLYNNSPEVIDRLIQKLYV